MSVGFPLPRWGRRTTSTVFFAGLALIGAYIIAFVIPLQASGPLRDFALKHNGDLREEFGWDNLVRTVAQIRDSLPPDQQAHLGIATGNYGEYGAIEILGAAYGLPQPIGTTNSEYLRGYPTPQPTTIIVIGNDPATANALFPTAGSPDTTATPKASRTRRASTTPTSLSVARRACPGQRSGKTTRTSARQFRVKKTVPHPCDVFVFVRWVGVDGSPRRLLVLSAFNSCFF